jgi:hypothetical protein
VPDDEELRILDMKVKQLKLDYDRYFLGTRPREPNLLRGEVQKLIAMYSNQAIQNTALRFRFSSLCSRFQALRRQWDENLRRMEQGTYARDRFRADLHQRDRTAPAAATGSGSGPAGSLYEEYRDARLACGQEVAGLTPEVLQRVLAQQRGELRRRFGSDTEVRFRVVVEDGKARLKASRAPS